MGKRREAGIALGVPLRRKEGDGICARVEQREASFRRKGQAGCLLKDANAAVSFVERSGGKPLLITSIFSLKSDGTFITCE